jgi:hypothetical protein
MNVLNSASGESSGNGKKKQPDADIEAAKRSGGAH